MSNNNLFNNLINSQNINSVITQNISSLNFFSDFDKDFFSVLDEDMRQTTNQFLVESDNITQFILSSQEENVRRITSLFNQENNYTEQDYIDDSLQETSSFKKLISEEGKKQLQKVKYSKNEKNSCCPITLIDFNDNNDVIKLPCGHCFEPTAIEYWLTKEKAECPICRFQLDHNE
jgi:hypothetical protein